MSANRTICLLLLVACRAQLGIDPSTRFSCETDGDCPSGNVCQLTLRLCVLSAASDNTAPTISSVIPVHHEAIRVSFSEALDPSALARADNYAIAPALAIRTVIVEDVQSVLLSVSSQETGAHYTLTLGDAVDLAGNHMVPPNNSFAFDGLGPGADPFPPAPLLPVPGSVLYSAATTLKWTAQQRASRYVVDLAYNADYSAPVPGAPFTTTTSSLDLPALEARSYYWRVRADTTAAGAYGESSFDVVLDRVRVYCAADPCGVSGVGNFSKPLTSITRAVLVAAASGVDRVDVASRPNGLAYHESFSLQAGVSIYGGYAADFSEAARDPKTARTTIVGVGAKAVSAITLKNATTVLEGLHIEGNPQTFSQALAIYDCDSGLVVRHCDLIGASGAGESSTGLNTDRMASSAPTIEDCVIRGGSGYKLSSGINMTFSNVNLYRNHISGGDAVEESYGIRTDDQFNSRPLALWANNIIVAGAAPTSTGAQLNKPVRLTNNVVAGGKYGIHLMVDGAQVTNNIVFAPHTCMFRNSGQEFASMHNNIFADCTLGGVACFNTSTCISLTSGNLNDPGLMLGAAVAATAISGNQNGSTSTALFLGPGDYHLSDASLAKSSGLNAGFDLCGPAGNTTCGAVSDDIDRTPRDAPYSSGAYEQ